jgi:hypothetical protein
MLKKALSRSAEFRPATRIEAFGKPQGSKSGWNS